MNLETAVDHIRQTRQLMDAEYQKPVFDEWILLSIADGKMSIVWYDGPRTETIMKRLHADSAPIAREMQDRSYTIGDFEFTSAGRGSRFDASVRVGETTYLFCNNTYGTMEDLRQDARWLKAQKPLLNLTEKFRVDPLV